jgi:uncharacterized lipoprotein
MNKIASIVSVAAAAFGLAACDVNKTQEGNVTLPKYEKTQEGNVTVPKYEVTPPDVKVTTTQKEVKVPTVKTEERTIEVPKVEVTPAKDR